MSRYLYAVVCANSRCGWGDPDMEEVQHTTVKQARQDLRNQNNAAPCAWCGTRVPYKILRKPIGTWEETK